MKLSSLTISHATENAELWISPGEDKRESDFVQTKYIYIERQWIFIAEKLKNLPITFSNQFELKP